MRKKVMFDGFYKGNELNHEGKVILDILNKHFDIEVSEEPEYIFCNVDSEQYYKYDGVRIFCTIEAICPDFNLCDYGIGFELLEYGDRYYRFPNYAFYPDKVAKMAEKHKNISDKLTERDFCSFVYSNANAASSRKQLYEILSAYKRVDAGGNYLNNLPDGRPVEDKLSFEAAHKFSIACENASCPGYHTEKLIDAFASQTVPIYWGDPCVKDVFNSKAFICAADFDSDEKLLEEICRLDKDDEAYLKMLKEPALLEEPDSGEDYATQCLKGLENYLVHIFDQPIEKSYRRNMGFWGKQYLDKKRCESSIIERYMRLKNSNAGKMLRKIVGR
ncbi:MAG: glycosyltransferase family 10 [Blautia sp.]|nr:glycosyltransferase family 10 [Blautia sp.]